MWHHLNKFIEMHNSSDVTIGPRLFLLCPGTVENSRVWFTDLWNYAIVPYLMDAVREGLQLYGKRTAWEDPTQFVLDTYPWPDSIQGGPESLLRFLPFRSGKFVFAIKYLISYVLFINLLELDQRMLDSI